MNKTRLEAYKSSSISNMSNSQCWIQFKFLSRTSLFCLTKKHLELLSTCREATPNYRTHASKRKNLSILFSNSASLSKNRDYMQQFQLTITITSPLNLSTVYLNKEFWDELTVYIPLTWHGRHRKRKKLDTNIQTRNSYHKTHKPKKLGGLHRPTDSKVIS
jgi:hypothetical protein